VTRTVRLSLTRPAALAGAREGIWIADAGSMAAVLFDGRSAEVLARVRLEHEPVSIAATTDVIAIALDSAEVLAIGASDRNERWRRRCTSGDVMLGASKDRVWAWDRGASAFLTWDRSGGQQQLGDAGAVAFAPSDTGVYSMTADGALQLQTLSGRSTIARLPAGAEPAGALVACANSLWVGVARGVVLAAQDTLAPRATLPVPEAYVTHLVCFHGRVFGGGRYAVFSVEPAADDNARALGIKPSSPLRGLGVSGHHLWVLESAAPEVHIVEIP
jgi:hypothetical protein